MKFVLVAVFISSFGALTLTLSNASSMQEESENYSSQRRRDADQYAKEVLFSLEERLSLSLAQIRKGIETMESENISVQHLSEEKIA